MRNSPDVALHADFNNYIVYNNGTRATNWGGTSFAAPRWAAWLALVNQQVVAGGHPSGLGFINPTLYLIGQDPFYNNDFHDIASGNNDTNGQSKFYSAVIGYDLTTGWGSMNGQNLMTDLSLDWVNLSSLSINPSTIVGGLNAQGTVTLTGPAPYYATIALSSNNLPFPESSKEITNKVF